MWNIGEFSFFLNKFIYFYMKIIGFSHFKEITNSPVDLFPCGIYVFVFNEMAEANLNTEHKQD